MDIQWLDWATMLLRWLHVITAIAWIGASFYFVWLDLSLRTPSAENHRTNNDALTGELWAIHGGGFYQVAKYKSHPEPLPETLHWFKWEAYSTWLTGSALLIAVYYFKANAYLVGPDSWVSDPTTAILASVGYLVGSLAVYEVLMRYVIRGGWAQLIAGVVLVFALSWLAFELFAPRAAIIHVGAALATMMAANVFLVIIPSQKAFVAAAESGGEVDLTLSTNAKLRSTQNNYFTLPVLFCMLANHSAFVYAHAHAWIYVALFSLVAAWARHYFNAKHTGNHQPGILISAGVAFVLLIIASAWTGTDSLSKGSADQATDTSEAQVASVVAKHCTNCHANEPTQPGFVAPPGGLVFVSPADLLTHKDTVQTSVSTGFMPLGNMTGMQDTERQALLTWLEQAQP